MNQLSQEEWAAQVAEHKDAVVLDVRTTAEWADGVIPQAVCADILNPTAFFDKAKSFDKQKRYYVYCRSGARSAQACQLLEQRGFKAFNLQGGVLQWEGKLVEL